MTFEDLRLLASGFQPSKLFLTAVDLGVFESLAGSERSAAELAAAIGAESRATEIACNALVAMGILELGEGGYRNAEVARRFLDPAAPEYRGSFLKHLHATWEDWDALEDTWRTGRAPATRKNQRLPSSMEGVRHFILGMENLTRELAPKLAARLPLVGVTKVLDLGGGPGNYSLAFAQREPAAEVVHFDLPDPSTVARGFVAGKPGAERVVFLEGDFLTSPLGEGYGLVWASQILHALGEVELRRLLERIAAAMVQGGVLAIHDHFLNPDKVSPLPAALFGVHMLAATRGGRTHSFEEMEGWVDGVGFTPEQRIDYGGASRVLLARKR